MLAATATLATLAATAGCTAASNTSDSDTDGGPVTLELAQWWEPELPEGKFRALMDEFEAANPNIKVKLVSGPMRPPKNSSSPAPPPAPCPMWSDSTVRGSAISPNRALSPI